MNMADFAIMVKIDYCFCQPIFHVCSLGRTLASQPFDSMNHATGFETNHMYLRTLE